MGKKTLLKIDDKLGRINTHHEYSSCVSRDYINSLIDESYRHSISLERESEENEGRKIGKKDLERLRVEELNRLKAAEDYLSNEGINIHSLVKVGNIIEPEKNNSTRFRHLEIDFGKFKGVDPSRLFDIMENYVWRLDNEAFSHPVNRSAFAHLDFVKIHPYADGNGRIARILQNFTLEQRGYPHVIIPVEERELYLGVLNGALREDLRNKEHPDNVHHEQETLFHNYVESKVLFSVEGLEKELREKRSYGVVFENVRDKELIYSIAKALKGLGSKKGIPISANHIIKRGKNGHMVVSGDISKKDLEDFFDKKSYEKYGLSYSIEPIVKC